MCRRKRLTEASQRVPPAGALGLELGEPRLELRRHVVERGTEGCELVVAADGHPLGQAPVRDLPRGRGETAEVPDDRPPLQVRDPTYEREACEQPEEDPVACSRVGGVDQSLWRQDGEPRRGHFREHRPGERPVPGARYLHRRTPPRRHGDLTVKRRRRRHDPRSLEQHENVAGVERRTAAKALDEADIERNRRHDLAEATRSHDDVDGQPSRETRQSARAKSTCADDIQRRLMGEDPSQRPAVLALERALQRSRAREPLCFRLRPVGPLLVERKRGAKRLLAQGDLSRPAGAGHRAEPPVRGRQRDEREQDEIRNELELEAAQLRPPQGQAETPFCR